MAHKQPKTPVYVYITVLSIYSSSTRKLEVNGAAVMSLSTQKMLVLGTTLSCVSELLPNSRTSHLKYQNPTTSAHRVIEPALATIRHSSSSPELRDYHRSNRQEHKKLAKCSKQFPTFSQAKPVHQTVLQRRFEQKQARRSEIVDVDMV